MSRGFYFSENILRDIHTKDVSYRRTESRCIVIPITLSLAQQQQLKKLGIFYMLPRPVQPLKESSYAEGQSQTASQSEPLERATLLPGLSPGYIWLLSHITVVL
jgi:hypothetical protein